MGGDSSGSERVSTGTACRLASDPVEAKMAKNDRFVVRHPKGWAVRKPHADRASSVHPTQREAEGRAKEIVSNLGGGEVRIQGRDGQWRDSDTVPPGHDPNPPRDHRH